MKENILKRIFSNPILLFVFLLPIVPTLVLTCIGLYFGMYKFDFGVIAERMDGMAYTVKASYPSSNYAIGPIGSFNKARMYHEINGGKEKVSYFENFSTNDLNTLKMIINNNVEGDRKSKLLDRVDSYQIFSQIEDVFNNTRLDWSPIVVGLLLFTNLFYSFGRRILIILVWYIGWYFISAFGYFAHWLYPFRQPNTPYLFSLYEEYSHAFSEQFLANTLLVEVLIIIPALYFLKYFIVKIYPKIILGLNKVRDSNKF